MKTWTVVLALLLVPSILRAEDIAPAMKTPTLGGEPVKCGGPASVVCEAHQFCKFPDGKCGETEGFGECTDRPEMCTKIYQPVCGCDGKTHASSCVANAAGQSVNHQGACK